MNNILSEKEYQKYILKKLAASGYEVQPADHYDRLFAVSRQELMRFLETTQPDEMESLKKIYKEKTEEVIVSAINAEETKKRGSRLDVLKHGVEIANVPLKLMYAKGYTDIHALVAFSGKVKLEDKEYTEPGMNGFAEKKLPAEFDSDNYNVLIVADKYQTGFDQKKLCAMYILKKLHDVSTIQTLSRLNRICPPYDKHTFILDFVNNYDDIIKDFSKFYTVTELSNSITPSAMYDIEAKLDGYYVIDPDDVDKFNDLLYSGDISAKAKKNMTYLLQKTKKAIESHPTEERNEIILTVKHFVRFYEFLIQASCFEDKELHKKYNFLNYLKSYLKMGGSGGGFNLAGKIKASGFVQKKKEEHKTDTIKSDPVVKLPTAEQIALTPQKTEKLSQIIAEINSKTGKSYDNDVAVKAMLQIKDIMMKSEELKASAKNNTEKDFEFAYFDNIDDALIEGLNQNQDFFSLLLGNDEIKKEVLGIFAEEIYRGLRVGE